MIWVGLAGVAAVVGAWYLPVTVDEAWSLVVARRMNRGDRLYRDIFYGAAPLAIAVQGLAFRVLRPQGVVVRLLTVGYLIAEAWAKAPAPRMTRRSGVLLSSNVRTRVSSCCQLARRRALTSMCVFMYVSSEMKTPLPGSGNGS